ncbi:MAG TPA: LysM peptidoglycan-binding domain-containing protein [Puia sp.]|jgi:LysM repeat protein|nr:LysM peptidoglycan-binding domain-containing protein [Puia sp.]
MRIPAAVLLLLTVFFSDSAHGQSGELLIQGQTGKLYLEHTVVAKENWYSVGRLYNVSPKTLAPYNHHTLQQPLTIGQTLEIPLTTTNFSQDGVKTASETLVPVFHIVREKEWMYRISVNHNKVPIPTLEKWNHINGDQLHPGLHLIVGYLKVKTALSALATSVSAPVAAATPPPVSPVVHQALSTGNDAASTPVKTDSPAGTRVHPQATSPVPAQETTTTVKPPAVIPNAPHFDGGVFRGDFSDEGHSVNGQAGVFKSTSGWQDGKYYALMNNVNVGTIVKVTDPATGKSVFTKVLGQLPDMKESAGLTIRISNAAAAELGQGEGKFAVQVIY